MIGTDAENTIVKKFEACLKGQAPKSPTPVPDTPTTGSTLFNDAKGFFNEIRTKMVELVK